ncbi:MAG: PIN domain-containing protein [Actinobacteria bacterium]|nr:PIN domain-containing protein [Actinomycetota bacterium]
MGLTVLDASVVIGWLDEDDGHHGVATDALDQAWDRGERFALPVTALAECLVGPSRKGPSAVERVRSLIAAAPVTSIPISEDIAVESAALRAQFGNRLRLPDALVVATAIVLDADRLLTTDRRWPHGAALGFEGELEVL